MQLARLLKHVPDLMDKASGMPGSSPTLNGTNCIFTVRKYLDTEPRGHSATGGQGAKERCEVAHRRSWTWASNVVLTITGERHITE